MEKEPAGHSAQSEFTVAVIADSGLHPIGKFIHRSHGITLHNRALLSAVWHLSYYWEKEERKRLRSTM